MKVLSHLDGDLARLLRFREGLWTHSGKFEVVCFPQQTEFVREFWKTGRVSGNPHSSGGGGLREEESLA